MALIFGPSPPAWQPHRPISPDSNEAPMNNPPARHAKIAQRLEHERLARLAKEAALRASSKLAVPRIAPQPKTKATRKIP